MITCKNCGTEFDQLTGICPCCGTAAAQEEQSTSTAKRNKLIIALSVSWVAILP